MLFTEGRFFAFFAIVWVLHWCVRGDRTRKWVLLAASYAFYCAWDWRFLSLIVFSTLVDFEAGRRIAATDRRSTRRTWLLVSLGVNLGLLGAFKYFDFFAQSLIHLLGGLGLQVSATTLGLVLPVGISFYTFQTLSYTIDIHRRKLAPTREFTDFALYVGFFPQLVAGPIVRATDFLPQLRTPRRLADVRIRACLTLFLIGFAKKALLADTAAISVDRVFAAPESFDAADKALAVGLFGVQLYGDFSGYSDMAIASAGLLGFQLPPNFAFPFLARSITSLWRRWHLTLTTWFRDYVYFPLGGNRCSPRRSALNLLATFTLCGLWHGAAWTFVVWGALNGLLLLLERRLLAERLQRWPVVACAPYMIVVWTLILVLFRAPDLALAASYLAGLVGFGDLAPDVATRTLPPALWWLLLSAWTAHLALSLDGLSRLSERVPTWAFATAYGAVVALVLPWAVTEYRPFIYFRF